MKIYLAGAITNNPNYKEDFRCAERKIRDLNHIVLNPTCLPDDLPYHDYFPICFAMIDVADAVVILSWSTGVLRELSYLLKNHPSKQYVFYRDISDLKEPAKN